MCGAGFKEDSGMGACTALSLGPRSPGGGSAGLLGHGRDFGRFGEPSSGAALASCSAAF